MEVVYTFFETQPKSCSASMEINMPQPRKWKIQILNLEKDPQTRGVARVHLWVLDTENRLTGKCLSVCEQR